MKTNPTIAILLTAVLIPTLALAQSQPNVDTQTRISALFWSTLPILIIALAIFLIIRFAASGKRVKTYDDYRERHMQHMQRVEQTLEQIRQTLEKRP